VVVNNTSKFTGSVVGTDTQRDLAVIKICCDATFQSLAFGDASQLKPGSQVLAVGFVLGIETQPTVAQGVVIENKYVLEQDRWVIHADPPVNPGLGGGPLLSLTGQILGINTFVLRQTGQGGIVERLGFVISEQTVRSVLPRLKSPILATPTPTPPSPSKFTNQKYWYSVTVPATWKVDPSNADNVVLQEPLSGNQVRIVVKQINTTLFPTLSTYIKTWKPAALEGWRDFTIISERSIRTEQPLQAHEFVYKFFFDRANRQGISHWYLLGKYLVSIEAITEEGVWTSQQFTAIRNAIQEIQSSFQPLFYVSTNFGYSVSLPSQWTQVPPSNPSHDISVADPVGGTARFFVRVVGISGAGYSTVTQYGENQNISDASVLGRNTVFTGRPNPSYRMDYRFTDRTTGRLMKGAVTITFGGKNAVWVYIEDRDENWTKLQNTYEDILERVEVFK
jgi:hypothetical protein